MHSEYLKIKRKNAQFTREIYSIVKEGTKGSILSGFVFSDFNFDEVNFDTDFFSSLVFFSEI